MNPSPKRRRMLAVLLAACLLFQPLAIGSGPSAATAPLLGDVSYAESKTTQEIIFDGSQSAWAEQVLVEAYEADLTYPGVIGKYRNAITREEFATIAVRLYEKLTGASVQAGASPFTDTSNAEIIKANQLGIVKGITASTFGPSQKITRQQLATMILRALDAAVPGLDKSVTSDFPFSDKVQIQAYALTAMQFCYQHGIINGMGAGKVAPLDNTTREQAIAIIKRTYDSFGAPDAKGSVLLTPGPQPIKSETAKFQKIDFSNRLTMPKFDSRLTLYAATAPGKPASRANVAYDGGSWMYGWAADQAMKSPLVGSLESDGLTLLSGLAIQPSSLSPSTIQPINIQPINIQPITVDPIVIDPGIIEPLVDRPAWWTLPRTSGPTYSRADNAAFINWNGDKQRYFAFAAKNAGSAVNVVWQVSKAPFGGFADNWKTPPGLVKTGTVPIAAGEFVIDFGTFAPKSTDGASLYQFTGGNIALKNLIGSASTFRDIPRTQYKYYVRAVPVDVQGNPVGDPGTGLEVLYGRPSDTTHESTLQPEYELWAALRPGEPYGGKEFSNTMQKMDIVGMEPTSSPYWFQVRSLDKSASRIVIQVSAEDFTGATSEWSQPEGLVYSRSYAAPVNLNANYPNAVSIPFSSFGPAASSMKPGDEVTYYVRAVIVRPSNTPGGEEVAFTQSVRASYGVQDPVVFYDYETIPVPSYTPSVEIVHYEPIFFEDPAWAEHYIVIKAPKWNEVQSKFVKSNGDTLYPYVYYASPMMSQYDPTMTPDKYEKVLVPKFLKPADANGPATEVHIPPPADTEEDKSFWEELWEGITDFFSNIVSLVKDLTNWVASAYENIKTGLINFMVDWLPLDDEWKQGLKDALKALMETGLAAMGIPPSLPNFDQLTGMSIDYIAQVALTQAGIPANEITDTLIEETKDGIKEQINAASAVSTPNPIDAPFLKANPRYLYRPAYMDLKFSNPFDDYTLPASFSIDAEWEWTENVSLTTWDWAQHSQDQQFATAAAYANHFVYGLSRGHNGYPIFYTLFEPVRSQAVPILGPGESVTVRIYLKEYYGKPYAFAINGDTVYYEDFYQMYFGTTGTTNIYNGQAVSQGYDTRFRVYIDSLYKLPDARTAAQSLGKTGSEPNTIYSYVYDYGQPTDGFEQIAAKAYD